MAHLKTILFDFDGTIADTLSTVIEIVNKNAQSWGYRQVKADEIEKLKGMTPFEVMKEFAVPFYKVPFLVKKVQMELFADMDIVRIFPGMKKTIQELHDDGFHLGIITSNTEENVKRFLNANDITSFHYIHSERNIFGKSRSIENFIHHRRLNKAHVIYIGDEVRDIEAARKSGIECVSVTWGFNTKKLLTEHTPQYIVDTPKALLTILEGLH